MSNSLQPNELQHTRPLCPSPTPGVHPNPCPLVGDAIQPSHHLSSPSLPALNLSQHQGLFKCQLLASGGQSIGVAASKSVLPMNTLDLSPLGWTGWISLQSKGLFKSLLQHHSSKASILWRSAFFTVQLSPLSITSGKPSVGLLGTHRFQVKNHCFKPLQLFSLLTSVLTNLKPQSEKAHICLVCLPFFSKIFSSP